MSKCNCSVCYFNYTRHCTSLINKCDVYVPLLRGLIETPNYQELKHKVFIKAIMDDIAKKITNQVSITGTVKTIAQQKEIQVPKSPYHITINTTTKEKMIADIEELQHDGVSVHLSRTRNKVTE